MEYSLDELNALIKSNDTQAIQSYMSEHNLCIKDGSIVPIDTEPLLELEAFWNQRQQTRK